MAALRRPDSLEAGIEQLRVAVQDTQGQIAGGHPSEVPRARLWRACNALLAAPGFVDAMGTLYSSNAFVAFLFNTIVPHIEERLRFGVLDEEHARASEKPENVAQNSRRFDAIVATLSTAAASVSTRPHATQRFKEMRDGLCALWSDAAVLAGLLTLYVASKTARKALDMIFERLIQTFENDIDIVSTSDIPFEALTLGSSI